MNDQLIGTWQLIAHKYGDATAFTDVQNEQYIHRKFITAHHFIWITCDRQTNQVLEAAGGACTFDQNAYSETPQYGLGPNFELVRDQQHLFTYTLQGEQWTMVGTLQLNGPEPSTLKSEEVWERLR